MMIVLEGIDGVGKTTLANLLSKTYDAGIIHATRETPNDWDWFNELMDLAKDRNIIMDRSFWGQFVYQDPGERKLNWRQLHELEHRLEQEDGKLIYVTANTSDILERLKGRAETLSRPLDLLKERYEAVILLSECPVIIYNTSTGEVQ